MILVKNFDFTDTELADISRSIRQSVFVEEQGVDPDLEYDGNDAYATHYIMYYYEKPIGTARSRTTTLGIKLERFAILKEWRNKGLGKHMLKKVMKDVEDKGLTIYLHAQEKAVNYYSRVGFEIEGEAFEEAGIRHFKMVLK